MGMADIASAATAGGRNGLRCDIGRVEGMPQSWRGVMSALGRGSVRGGSVQGGGIGSEEVLSGGAFACRSSNSTG